MRKGLLAAILAAITLAARLVSAENAILPDVPATAPNPIARETSELQTDGRNVVFTTEPCSATAIRSSLSCLAQSGGLRSGRTLVMLG